MAAASTPANQHTHSVMDWRFLFLFLFASLCAAVDCTGGGGGGGGSLEGEENGRRKIRKCVCVEKAEKRGLIELETLQSEAVSEKENGQIGANTDCVWSLLCCALFALGHTTALAL